MNNICNGAIRWLISTSIKIVLEHFLLTRMVFQILNIIHFQKLYDPENIAKGHDAQHSHWHHSMANT